MNKLYAFLIVIAVAVIEGVVIHFLTKKLKKLSTQVDVLERKLKIQEVVNERFSNIDKDVKNKKDDVSSGSYDERLNNSLNILSDIETKRKST